MARRTCWSMPITTSLPSRVTLRAACPPRKTDRTTTRSSVSRRWVSRAADRAIRTSRSGVSLPRELNGAQDVLVDANNNIVTEQSYLASRLSAAENGQNYNPLLGFSPVGVAGGGSSYPYKPFWGEFAPRVSIAWNPDFGDSWLGKLFGHKNTVIRAGYGRFYAKTLGIDQVSTPVLGDGFLQPVSCINPNSAGRCTSSGAVTPASAFRIGVDGNASPFPAIPQTLPSPVIPCYTQTGACNSSGLEYSFFLDNAFKPATTDQINITIQRELKGNVILEEIGR